MLCNLIKKIKNIFKSKSEQEKLDEFISQRRPTSVAEVEYWITTYDRIQYKSRSSNFYYNYR